MILALLKTLITLVLDILIAILYSTNNSNVPFEEVASRMKILARTIVGILVLILIVVVLYTIKINTSLLKSRNDIIHKQVAIVRECRPDYQIENILEVK